MYRNTKIKSLKEVPVDALENGDLVWVTCPCGENFHEVKDVMDHHIYNKYKRVIIYKLTHEDPTINCAEFFLFNKTGTAIVRWQ